MCQCGLIFIRDMVLLTRDVVFHQVENFSIQTRANIRNDMKE